MKINKLLYFVLGLSLFYMACDPIEETYDLGGVLSSETVLNGISANTEKPGNNKLVLRNNLNVGGIWDYGVGTSSSKNPDIIVPPGTYDIKFTALCDGGIVSVTKTTLEVTNVEYDLSAAWINLCGTVSSGGKTWKLDSQVPYNWTNLSGGFLNTWNSRADIIATGWAPYGDADVVNIDNASIKFAVSGVVVVTQDNGTSGSGKFTIDEANSTIKFSGITPTIPIASWVTCTTDANNKWKILIEEKTDGVVTGYWFGQIDSGATQYTVFHFVVSN